MHIRLTRLDAFFKVASDLIGGNCSQGVVPAALLLQTETGTPRCVDAVSAQAGGREWTRGSRSNSMTQEERRSRLPQPGQLSTGAQSCLPLQLHGVRFECVRQEVKAEGRTVGLLCAAFIFFFSVHTPAWNATGPNHRTRSARRPTRTDHDTSASTTMALVPETTMHSANQRRHQSHDNARTHPHHPALPDSAATRLRSLHLPGMASRLDAHSLERPLLHATSHHAS